MDYEMFPIGGIYRLDKDGVAVMETDHGPVPPDGRWVAKEQYPELYKVLKASFAENFDETEDEFKLPDYRGRVANG